MRKFNLRPRTFKNILLRCSSSSASFKPKIIETIPPGLHFHLFGTDPPKTASLKELQLQLPQLKGKSIEEHFRIIASEQGTAYLPLLEKAAEYFKYNYDKTKANHWVNSLVADGPHCSKFRPLSEIHWEFRTGWTRYCHEDGTSRQVPYPEEDALFFDVEVCVQDGLLPTLAVALSDRAWYGWCSERLVYEDAKFPENGATLEHLIPIGDPHRGRVVIGHNVGYDRARVRESYFQKEHQIRFMDTMSMSVSMFGMADHQAETYKEAVEFEELPKDKTNKYAVKRGWEPAWRKRVTKNNLKDVANFLLGIPVDKEMRSYFVKDSIDVIREHFQELMRYCAQDNLVTALVFSKMWPMFRKRCPEDVTTLGMMNMGNAYLPINQNWRRFFDKTNEDNDNSKQQDGAWNIIQAAKVLHEKQNLDDKFITDDFWMFSYADKKWFRSLFKNTKAMNAVNDYGTKYLAADDVVLKSQIVPCLFGLIYNNRPVFFLKKHGWGYISPRETRRKEAWVISSLIMHVAGSSMIPYPFSPWSCYSLKHFHRNPLDFSRLRQRSKLQIIKKASAPTQLKLLEVSYYSNFLVELVFIEIPYQQMLFHFMDRFTLDEVLSPSMRLYFWLPVHETQSLYVWTFSLMSSIWYGPTEEGKSLLGTVVKSHRNDIFESQPLSILWEPQQVHGPRSINLASISRNMLLKVTVKASLLAVSRLARTSSFGNETAATCLRSFRLDELDPEIEPRSFSQTFKDSTWAPANGAIFLDTKQRWLPRGRNLHVDRMRREIYILWRPETLKVCVPAIVSERVRMAKEQCDEDQKTEIGEIAGR